jgi:PhzF family phenazine biosynthesis protein
MTTRPFTQVDVFTSTAYLGNPVAVVLEGTGLSDASMQSFACWTQLSETTFLLPPTPEAKAKGADYRLRIFTPGGELPFAGHPTLGSARAWRQAGGQPQKTGVMVQECGVGLVRIEAREDQWAFAAPPSQQRDIPADMMPRLLDALGLRENQIIQCQVLNNGPEWWSFLLDTTETLHGMSPNHMALKQLGTKVGVAAISQRALGRPDPASELLISRSNRESRAFAGRAPSEFTSGIPLHDADLEVRAFAAAIGIAEDPVTGSLNASLAQWLIGAGKMPAHYVASQGQALGRQGRVHIQQDSQGQVWVGGDTVVCIEGHVALD